MLLLLDSTFVDVSSFSDNLARVLCGVSKKINTPSGYDDFVDMRTAFYLGMGRPKSSPLTTPLCHLWATARHSTDNHEGIVTGMKGQLQIKSDISVEFTCLYDCEKTDLAIISCKNISNNDLHVHEFGSLLYPGESLKLAGFGQTLEQANLLAPSVKSVNVALTNCSIYDSDDPVGQVGWRNLKFFVVDQVVDCGYCGSPVYHPVSREVIGMLCGSFEEKFTNISMCLKANYIGDALAENFVVKRKRTFSP